MIVEAQVNIWVSHLSPPVQAMPRISDESRLEPSDSAAGVAGGADCPRLIARRVPEAHIRTSFAGAAPADQGSCAAVGRSAGEAERELPKSHR